MKKILLDANILLAILFSDDERHDDALNAARIAAQRFHIVLAPSTFVICNYYIEKDFKRHKNKEKRDRLPASLFAFSYSTEDDALLRQVEQSAFHDKEDAVQYFSALRAKAKALLTFNTFDFTPYASGMKIYHPVEFMLTYGADS